MSRPASGSPTPGPASGPRRGDGLRFALGTLTVLPVTAVRWDRDTARAGMVCAPLAGLLVGVVAAAAGTALLALGGGPLLAAVGCVGADALLTRGLHLDGLADTADGLGASRLARRSPAPGQAPEDGSGAAAETGLRVMRQPDIGPFGVVTLVLVLLARVAALAKLYTAHGWVWATLATVTAALAGRTALTLACRTGVPAARPEGLGAAVANLVPVRTALGVAVAVTATAGGVTLAAALLPAGAASPSWPVSPVSRHLLAVPVALLAAELVLRHCRRRFGGLTGDVLGALAETATTTAVLVCALAR